MPYLAGRPDSTGAVGAIGFCWGGGAVNQLASASPELKAGVAYYGRQVDAARVAKIKVALMLHNAANAARYDKKAANLARSRTVAFLKKNLA